MDVDVATLARFPYLPAAQQYVRDAGVSLDQLLQKTAYRRVLERGKGRLLEAVQQGEVRPPAAHQPDVEVFSYAVARMLASCIGDRYLLVRYAEAESKLARRYLEDAGDLEGMARELGFMSLRRDGELWMHYSEYVSLAARVGDDDYRLANQVVSRGMVQVRERQVARLLQEAVRLKVLTGLPARVTPSVCQALEPLAAPVRDALLRRRREYESAGLAARPDCYPPCVARLLEALRAGENLSHTARFALTTFLHRIGFEEEAVLELYRAAPDFDEPKALYQIRHVCSKGDEGYPPPSCATMQTYGNCLDPDRLCQRVKHPLSYYRAATRRKRDSPPPDGAGAEGGTPEHTQQGEGSEPEGGAPRGDGSQR